MDTLTPEQEQRRDTLFALRQLLAAQQQYQHLVSPYGNTLWIHVTDTHMMGDDIIDVIAMMDDGILKPVDVDYQMQGDWRDRFAPAAYILTAKGLGILENSSLWVFKGETVDRREKHLAADLRRQIHGLHK